MGLFKKHTVLGKLTKSKPGGTVIGNLVRSVGPTVANLVAPGSGNIVDKILPDAKKRRSGLEAVIAPEINGINSAVAAEQVPVSATEQYKKEAQLIGKGALDGALSGAIGAFLGTKSGNKAKKAGIAAVIEDNAKIFLFACVGLVGVVLFMLIKRK